MNKMRVEQLCAGYEQKRTDAELTQIMHSMVSHSDEHVAAKLVLDARKANAEKDKEEGVRKSHRETLEQSERHHAEGIAEVRRANDIAANNVRVAKMAAWISALAAIAAIVAAIAAWRAPQQTLPEPPRTPRPQTASSPEPASAKAGNRPATPQSSPIPAMPSVRQSATPKAP